MAWLGFDIVLLKLKVVLGKLNMKLVAFKPQGILAPERVLYAMVPLGEVTLDLWLDCLAHRLQIMLNRRKWFKRSYANKICKVMGFPFCDDLNQFGKYLIEYKSIFKESIKCSFDNGKNPFPVIVMEQDDKVFEDIQIVNLETWAGLAHLVTSGILLSDSKRYMDYAINKEYFSNN